MELQIGKHASYLKIKNMKKDEKVNYTKEMFKDIYFDFDRDHNLLGIEFLEEVKVSYNKDYNKKEGRNEKF